MCLGGGGGVGRLGECRRMRRVVEAGVCVGGGGGSIHECVCTRLSVVVCLHVYPSVSLSLPPSLPVILIMCTVWSVTAVNAVCVMCLLCYISPVCL